jgi:hypothetical protein
MVALLCTAIAGPCFAQEQAASAPKPLSSSLGVAVFPAKGQTPTQQSQDEGECYAWAKGQTGFDPMAPPAAASPPPPAQSPASAPPPQADGSRLRGAARGAAAGAVIGEVASDDAGKGAAIGATAGVMKGGAESRRKQAQAQQQAVATQEQQQQAAAQEQQAAREQELDFFRKSFGACLEAKDYTVK